ncbi:hypothetical protein E1286_16220 [Nonomuraea terrae]|uniref:Uncharacterized protein n=1 Tax=Nonomuraea terrae TaxID=2530383 RepID=A0A4R4YRS8_9ACTN|nr:hypothetical protein [Nonomuraea terrae]TDD47985.1 hypothetical protein E1286_16220 [Nonomuraea terrae]
MNRVVKTAVAVTAFGLAAALAAPAQAEVRYDTAGRAIDVPLLGTTAGSPLGGLLGGLVSNGIVDSVLGGLTQAKSAASPAMSEAQRDAYMERQTRAQRGYTPNAEEDVTRETWPMPEISPIVAGTPFGGRGMAASVPTAQAPSVKRGRAVTQGTAAADGAMDDPIGGTLAMVNDTVEGLSPERVMAGLNQAARMALPGVTGDVLSPALGQDSATAAQPVAEAVKGVSEAASVTELAPVVEEAASAVTGGAAAGALSPGDVISTLGWTTGALTGSVQGSGPRD